jgi:GMP synthase-like glutamine amidotransferase
MARALGASVYPATTKELGWYPLRITQEGKHTPVRYFDERDCTMFHWHGDTFDLPFGAQLLASSDACQNQVYQWGNMRWRFNVTQKSLPPAWRLGMSGMPMKYSMKNIRRH